MFQGKRGILKGGMPVRHGRMAGIAGIGKQGQISQGQLPHQLSAFGPGLGTGRSTQLRMQQQRGKVQQRQGEDQEQAA